MEYIVSEPSHQIVTVFTPDPSIAHILSPLLEGPADVLVLIDGPENPIHTLCGAGFLPGQILEVAPAYVATRPTCTSCCDAL